MCQERCETFQIMEVLSQSRWKSQVGCEMLHQTQDGKFNSSVMFLAFWTVCLWFCVHLAAKGCLGLLDRPWFNWGSQQKINALETAALQTFKTKQWAIEDYFVPTFQICDINKISAIKEYNLIQSHLKSIQLFDPKISPSFFLSIQCEKMRWCKTYKGRKRNTMEGCHNCYQFVCMLFHMRVCVYHQQLSHWNTNVFLINRIPNVLFWTCFMIHDYKYDFFLNTFLKRRSAFFFAFYKAK